MIVAALTKLFCIAAALASIFALSPGMIAGKALAITPAACRDAETPLPATRAKDLRRLMQSKGTYMPTLPESKIFAALGISLNDALIDNWRQIEFPDEPIEDFHRVLASLDKLGDFVFTHRTATMFYAFRTDARLNLVAATKFPQGGEQFEPGMPDEVWNEFHRVLSYWHCRTWVGESGVGPVRSLENRACRGQPMGSTKERYLDMIARRLKVELEYEGNVIHKGKIIYQGDQNPGYDFLNFRGWDSPRLTISTPFTGLTIVANRSQRETIDRMLTIATMTIAHFAKRQDIETRAELGKMLEKTDSIPNQTGYESMEGLPYDRPVARANWGNLELVVLPPDDLGEIRIIIERVSCK